MRQTNRGVFRQAAPESLRMRPDSLERREEVHRNPNLSPMSDLDLAIKNGWGDKPQSKMPADWRTRKNPKGKVELI